MIMVRHGKRLKSMIAVDQAQLVQMKLPVQMLHRAEIKKP